MPVVRCASIHQNCARSFFYSEENDFCRVPPIFVTRRRSRKVEFPQTGLSIATEGHAQKLTAGVVECIAVILIERSLASGSGIHLQLERTLRHFGRILNYGLLRIYGSAPDIDRHRI